MNCQCVVLIKFFCTAGVAVQPGVYQQQAAFAGQQPVGYQPQQQPPLVLDEKAGGIPNNPPAYS